MEFIGDTAPFILLVALILLIVVLILVVRILRMTAVPVIEALWKLDRATGDNGC